MKTQDITKDMKSLKLEANTNKSGFKNASVPRREADLYLQCVTRRRCGPLTSHPLLLGKKEALTI